jgi:hypothetical protein
MINRVGQFWIAVFIVKRVSFQLPLTKITSMLEDRGYEWQPVRGPSTGQPVRASEEHGQYKMLFRAADKVTV